MALSDYALQNGLTQAKWIHDYNDAHREKFNPVLFHRDNYEIVEALKKVILSCQRNSAYFMIKVENFTVVEDYAEICDILYEYEQKKIDKTKNSKAENPYSLVNIKDSDIMLLIVDYFVAIKDENGNIRCDEAPVDGKEPVKYSDHLRNIIEIPRYVDKYYFRVAGATYNPIMQIVDGSTYNNSSSNAKKASVTFKTVFIPARINRIVHETNCGSYGANDVNGMPFRYIIYEANIFSKVFPIIDYFLAKFGLVGAIDYFGLTGMIQITTEEPTDPSLAVFSASGADGVYMSAPRVILENDIVTQTVFFTIFQHMNSKEGITIAEMFDNKYWVQVLASRFTNKAYIEKGYSVLNSLESELDLDTQESLMLPWEDKCDIYAVLRWMIREFPQLRLRDITDISTKRIRRPEYMAAMYAAKISRGINRASDSQRAITVKDICRYISVEPDFLLNRILKDKLVGYRDNVNDDDAINALKFSYKGISGLGENRNSTIPLMFRRIHHSHIGRVDIDTSSAGDPGLTGIVCPMTPIYNGRSFSQFEEPNGWREEFSNLVNSHREEIGKRQLIQLKSSMPDVFPDVFAPIEKSGILNDLEDYKLQTNSVALDMMTQVEEVSNNQVNNGGDVGGETYVISF